MKKTIITLFTSVMIIGIIALALNNMFGNVVNFNTQEAIPGGSGLTWYKYDTFSYIENIKNTFKNTAQLTLQTPNRTWVNAGFDFWDQGEFWEATWNNLALILDWILFGLNVILYPIRLGGYFLQIVMSIIGINVINYDGNPIKWLIDLTYFLTELQISYI